MNRMKKNYLTLAVFVLAFCGAEKLRAAQIFYESFEDPVVASAASGTDPTGWDDLSTGSNDRAGLGYLTGTSYTNFVGDQAAWLNVYNCTPVLKTTTSILNTNLVAGLKYTLRFNVAASYTGYVVYGDLLAGTNVILTAYVNPAGGNFSNNVVQGSTIALAGDPGVGEALSIRLRVTNGTWDQHSYVDNLSLDAVDTSSDVTPPSPGTMVWDGLPTSGVGNGITMQATNATDDNLVQYFFTNTVNGNVSGWQESSIWTDTGLTPGQTYTYKVKARDKSVNLNETGWSAEASADCEAYIILYESFETPDIPGSSQEWGAIPGYAPDGWMRGGSRTYTRDENYFSLSTPFGKQTVSSFLGSGYYQETTGLTDVLEADYTYTLTFNAGNYNGGSDSANSDNEYTVELRAGSTIVTSVTAVTSTMDLSETNSLVFIPDAANTNLGKTVKIRLWMSGGDYHAHAMWDNIKLRAVPPPPAGTVFIIR